MKVSRRVWLLSLMFLVAPLSVVWGVEKARENPQIARTASKVTLPDKARDAQQNAQFRKQIDKERAALRQYVIAKKMQKAGLAKKGKTGSLKGNKKRSGVQARNAARIPSRIGIRTWSYPESAGARVNKMTELSARIAETENAYDVENAHFQRLNREYSRLKAELGQAEKAMQTYMEPQSKAYENYKKAQEKAKDNPQVSIEPQRLEYLRAVERSAAATASAGKTLAASSARLAPLEAKLSASQVRLNDITNQLDALHQHRNAVSEVVFLRTVKD